MCIIQADAICPLSHKPSDMQNEVNDLITIVKIISLKQPLQQGVSNTIRTIVLFDRKQGNIIRKLLLLFANKLFNRLVFCRLNKILGGTIDI